MLWVLLTWLLSSPLVGLVLGAAIRQADESRRGALLPAAPSHRPSAVEEAAPELAEVA